MEPISGGVRIEIIDEHTGALGVLCPAHPAFSLRPLLPALRIDGAELSPSAHHAVASPGAAAVEYAFGSTAVLAVSVDHVDASTARLRFALRNISERPWTLNHVVLLGTTPTAPRICFGADPRAVRILEQSAYFGQVRPLAASPAPTPAGTAPGEPGSEAEQASRSSQLLWLAYDRAARHAFLAGFETSERWVGSVEIKVTKEGGVAAWRAGFDGGDLLVAAGAEVKLESLLVMAGAEPLDLMDACGDAIRARHNPRFPSRPPVSWCSWYPYRLGVTEERVLENARIAAERLKPLGFSIVEVDLGWERDQLPNTFDENAQFPSGLKWLSDRLAEFDFDLGVWVAPFTISEFDPEFKAHPEWLIRDEKGEPAAYWEWFWAPHGKVYILDLTHSGAQDWLRRKIRSLRDRGVRYLKADFVSCVSGPLAKNRRDKSIVAGGGAEASRIGARIIREELPEALLLNCGGPEQPGTGHWPLQYQCQDTGNTGYITWGFHRLNFQAVACHLFKNRRWAIIQPSCLCVGLPGTVEEARLRATVAFLAAGQIDISDTLTTLPEDRWEILTATLPVLDVTARPIDLFDPVYGPDFNYVATCKQEGAQETRLVEHAPGSVWHVHVKADWDEWDLVGLFDFASVPSDATPCQARFLIPMERLGLASDGNYWGYEFWSRQFLGALPGGRTNPRGYAHPGDFQDLVCGNDPKTLDIAFFGPAARLVCVRKKRHHPWVVGTSFHQSCGAELRGVRWDAASGTLSGEIRRPRGETGILAISGAGRAPVAQKVDGRDEPLRPGANGCWILPVTMAEDSARWSIRFG